jgi:hypothetical protein
MGENGAMHYLLRLVVNSWKMEIVLPFEGGVVAIIRNWLGLGSVQEQSFRHASRHGWIFEVWIFKVEIVFMSLQRGFEP